MDKHKELLKDVENLYTENILKHGLDSKSVGWKDKSSQVTRFQKLVQSFNLEKYDEALSFNDLGCGYGEMFHFLCSNTEIKIKQYNGYDISMEMLDAAKINIQDQRARWYHESKIVSLADFTFVSGTFNVRFAATYQEWKEYIINSLGMINECSNVGFAFNLLSTYVDWQEQHLFYGDPTYFFDFCKRNFSQHVALHHDYPLYEWTIAVLK